MTPKPCPKCGSRDVRVLALEPMVVYCPQCWHQGPEAKTADAAIRKWNAEAR